MTPNLTGNGQLQSAPVIAGLSAYDQHIQKRIKEIYNLETRVDFGVKIPQERKPSLFNRYIKLMLGRHK